jgi:hypothetical protein
MRLPPDPRRVAVNYDLKAGILAFRSITPSGRLGKRLDVMATRALLKSAVFVFDHSLWRNWMDEGQPAEPAMPSLRRFGHIEGDWHAALRAPVEPDPKAVQVFYRPRERPDFHCPQGHPVARAQAGFDSGPHHVCCRDSTLTDP